ncbi:MAG: substrate-binding domain-containing protein [Firmicutes bacterium]|nr:substrate-binding domain-containing protein [Bacillota bacterium]
MKKVKNKVNLRSYYIMTGLRALFLSPVIVSIGQLIGAALSIPLIIIPIILLALFWVLYARVAKLPENASQIFMPIFVVFCYYMGVWICVFGLSHYYFGSSLFSGVYSILTIPFFIINVFLTMAAGDYSSIPLINAGIMAVTVLSIIITCAICKKKIIYDRKIITYGLIIICLSGVAGYQQFDRDKKVLAGYDDTERVADEVDLYAYHPFFNDNQLAKPKEAPAVSFAANYPKLDGATAAYPVYAATAQALYKGLDAETVEQYITCSNTNGAYERLINGEIDIFFGAQPSKQQIQKAKENGVAFTLTPIAKEAFVFFVNKDNPVNSLTLGQLQDIYQKRITNWRDVGGNNEKITPFQRPDNSGSQTIMLARVMQGKPLPPPLGEEYADGMGEIISQVAVYRNYSSAIGYSFRYFATGMKPNENIKLLAINAIEPTVENIRNGAYPFVIDAYAVTAGLKNENTEKLINWILSKQGQDFIEQCGYVRE